MPKPPARAGIYTRLSLAVMEDDTKVQDQARISRNLAAALNWTIAAGCGHPGGGGVYTDNSRSAWRRGRKRPAWDQMLADVEAGKLDSIIVYHGDRLVRQPFDLETLINLAEGRGIRLASPTGMRDLDNTDDRFVLRILVAQACMESDNTSRRKKAQYDRMRREGRTRPGGPGGRFYGFMKDGTTHVPAETALIRDMDRRNRNLEGTRRIAASLNARGAKTVTGKPWTHAGVKRILLNPRYAGLMPDGEQKAAWEPVLEREDWETGRVILTGRGARYTGATSERRYLLSGIALCGTCSKPVGPRHSSRSRLAYGCMNPACPRKLHRSLEHVDALIDGLMPAWLSSPELAALIRKAPEPAVAAEITALEKRKSEALRQLENLADHPGLSLEVTARAIASFDERIAAVRERIAAAPGRRLLAQYQGTTRAQWKVLPLAVRRSLVAASFRITILPARRGPGFDPESVRVEWREQASGVATRNPSSSR